MFAVRSLFLLPVNAISMFSVFFTHLPCVWMHPPHTHPCSCMWKNTESGHDCKSPFPLFSPVTWNRRPICVPGSSVAHLSIHNGFCHSSCPPTSCTLVLGKLVISGRVNREVWGCCPKSGWTPVIYSLAVQIWVTKLAFWWLYGDILWREEELHRLLSSTCSACLHQAPLPHWLEDWFLSFVVLQIIKCSVPWVWTPFPFLLWLSLRSCLQCCGVCYAVVRRLECFSPRPAFSFPDPPLVLMACDSKAWEMGWCVCAAGEPMGHNSVKSCCFLI